MTATPIDVAALVVACLALVTAITSLVGVLADRRTRAAEREARLLDDAKALDDAMAKRLLQRRTGRGYGNAVRP